MTTTIKKYLVYLGCAGVFFLLPSCGGPGIGGSQNPSSDISANDVIAEVNYALDRVKSEISSSNLPPFKEAKLELFTQTKREGNIGASFVVSGNVSRARTHSTKLTMTLIPKKKERKESGYVRVGDLLAEQIKSAISAVDSQNKLSLKKLDVEGNLKIEKGSSAGFQMTYSGVTISGPNISSAREASHKLILSFEKS